MSPGSMSLRDELLAMAAEDHAVRTALAADGSLFRGYHPTMADVHRRNAARLETIIAQHGWPGRSLVGDAGAAAAWLVLQHAIGNPPLQRRGLELLKSAPPGEVSPAQVAMLDDRIRAFEGRPQLYGSQYDWDANGVLNPLPIEDPEGVDERRLAVGLAPLAENTTRIRETTAAGGQGPPPDWKARQQAKAEWERSVGWHD